MNVIFLEVLKTSFFCSFVILLLGFFQKIINRKYCAKWEYFIWFFLTIRMVIFIPISIPNFTIQIKAPIIEIEKQNPYITKSKAPASVLSNVKTKKKVQKETLFVPPNFIKQKKHFSFALSKMLPFFIIIWVFGVFFFLSFHIFTYFLFLKKVKRWHNLASDAAEHILKTQLKKQGMKNHISIYICDFISSPMMIGIFHSKILLPKEDYTKEQFELILNHELVHKKHFDLFFKLLLLFVNALHWFNPFIYYMASQIDYIIELFCDETVLENQSVSYRTLYSVTILQTMVNTISGKNIAFSTYFYGGKQKMKQRFYKIMHPNIRKKGIIPFSFFLTFILLTGLLSACGTKEPLSSITVPNKQAAAKTNTETEEDPIHILLIGIDSEIKQQASRADAILVASVIPQKGKIVFTSFLRDLYIEVPGGKKDKLSNTYFLGGSSLLKETLEMNFDFKIDGSVTIDYQGFRNIIDSLGGVEVSITEEEAKFLNRTNYISQKQNRSLKAGTSLLNGDQVLGYTRVRYVPTASNDTNDFGRTNRQREVLNSIFAQCKKASLKQLTDMITNSLPYVTTDLTKSQILSYANLLWKNSFSIDNCMIPVKNSFENKIIENRSVLVTDIEKNKNEIQKLIN